MLFSAAASPSLLPNAPKVAVAALVPIIFVIGLSSALRSRVSLGVHRWAAWTMGAALTMAVIGWASPSEDVSDVATLATLLLTYFAVLVTGGRRRYESSHRLEAIALVGAAGGLLLAFTTIGAGLGDLGGREQMMLVIAVLTVNAAVGLWIAQGWWPSLGVALLIVGSIGYLALLLASVDGSTITINPVAEAFILLVLLGGTIIGDHGLPSRNRKHWSAIALGLSAAVSIGVLIVAGAGGASSLTADVFCCLSLFAVFARTLQPMAIVAADPREAGGVDRLTGLPDRYELERVLGRELSFAQHSNTPLALAVIDASSLHEIVETLGHRVGDQVLREAANRLLHVSGNDVAVRLGGDTFALVMRAHASELDVRKDLEKMIEELEVPVHVDGATLTLQLRSGLAYYPAHGRTVDELLQRAEIATQEAKEKRLTLAVYDPTRDLRSRERLMFAAQLREGIQRDELRVFFQPKIDLASGNVIGAEALVRWQHPDEGLLTPDRFLEVAERTGLMPALTNWVLDAAMVQAKRWQDAGFALHCAVNLSPDALVDDLLPERLRQKLEAHGLEGWCLELEITEQMAMADPARTRETIRQINELGVGFALDDFGTGYSSLAHLKHLNCHELKIDRSFVRDLATDDDDRVIVWSILDLARNLGMRTVAEGIETEDVGHMLSMMGCAIGQGYHYARPLEADTFLAWCQERHLSGTIRTAFAA